MINMLFRLRDEADIAYREPIKWVMHPAVATQLEQDTKDMHWSFSTTGPTRLLGLPFEIRDDFYGIKLVTSR